MSESTFLSDEERTMAETLLAYSFVRDLLHTMAPQGTFPEKLEVLRSCQALLLHAFGQHGWESPEPSEQMEDVLAWMRQQQRLAGWDPGAPWPDPH